MADRNQAAQERANLIKQRNEIVKDYKAKSAELFKDLNAKTEASLNPLNEQIAKYETEIFKSVNQEAGVADA